MRLPLERHARRTAMARETRQCLRDFKSPEYGNNNGARALRRNAGNLSRLRQPGLALERNKPPRSSHEAYSYAHERLLVEGGGPIAGGTVGECCEDFMTSTNTYDPKGRL